MRVRRAGMTLVTLLALGSTGCGSHPAARLAHGVEETLRAVSADGTPAGSAATDDLASALRRNLRKHHAQATVRRVGASEIIVRYAGATLARPSAYRANPMAFGMYDLLPALLPPSRSADGAVVPYRSRTRLLAAASRGSGRVGLPPRTALIECSRATTSICPGDEDADGLPPDGQVDYYLFKNGAYTHDRYATDGRYPNLTGSDLQPLSIRQDVDSATGTPIVLMQFTKHADRAFRRVTKNEATRGKAQGAACGPACAFAIVLDGKLISWPTIDPTQNPQGIDPTGTGAEINNLGTLQKARALAQGLLTATLPVQLVLVSRRAY
jgi:hypothetical protein